VVLVDALGLEDLEPRGQLQRAGRRGIRIGLRRKENGRGEVNLDAAGSFGEL